MAVLYFEDTFLETLKLFVKMRKALTQEVLHFGLQYLYLPFCDVARPSEIDGMSYQMDKPSRPVLLRVQLVQVFGIPKQVGQADLMLLDVHIEIAPVPVRHKRRVGQTVRELGVYGLLASRLHLIHIGKQVVLEYPVPVQLFPDSGAGLVGSYYWAHSIRLRISSYAASALVLFSLSMFCTVPSLIF